MTQTERKPARRRVFFALWPQETIRRELLRATRTAVRRSGGRGTPPGNLHITLAFLGPLTEVDLAAAVRVPPIPSREFTIELDKLGYWPRSRVLWLGASQTPAELVQLERDLWDALVSVGFQRERRPYNPHVDAGAQGQIGGNGTQPGGLAGVGIGVGGVQTGRSSFRI